VHFGANVNISNSTGRTPLFYACLNDSSDIVRFLLENKADVNISSLENRSPFCMSLGKFGKDVSLMLIRNQLLLDPHPLFDSLHLELFKRWTPKDQLLLCYSIDYERSRRNRNSFFKFLYVCKFWNVNDLILNGNSEMMANMRPNQEWDISCFYPLLFTVFSNRDLCRIINKFL